MQRDGLAGLVPLLEVAALEHLRNVVLRREAHPPVAAQRLEPLAVEPNLCLLRVEDLEDLGLVALGVLLDLLRRQRRPRLGATGRIPDERGERTDHVDHGVPEILKVLHLPNEHRVTEMEVRRGGVEAHLHDERPAARGRPFELEPKLRRSDDVHAALGQIRELLVDGHGGMGPGLQVSEPGTKVSCTISLDQDGPGVRAAGFVRGGPEPIL